MTQPYRPKTFWGWMRHTFMRGLVVLVPLALTLWILNVIFLWLDRMISPLLTRLGLDVPGLGLLTMLALVLLVGILSRNLVGRFLFGRIDSIISKLPLARSIYTSIKGIIAAFPGGEKGKSFKEVVLVEYPRKGIYSIGFVTNDLKLEGKSGSRDVVSVYFPHPPNPTSGVMIIVPRADVRELDLSIEEGLKLALSGGIVAPERLVEKTQNSKRRKPPRPTGGRSSLIH
jgi:uncharacterized membrane protein